MSNATLIPPAPSDRRQEAVPQADFHSARYLRNDFRRMEHLATLGLDLRDKTVLEVGAGIGDLTTFFLDRGCRVVSTEGREGNLAMLRDRYTGEERVEVGELNLDPPPPPPPASHDGQRFEVVFCYGLLYHLSDPAAALRYLAACTGEVLLLETIVSFGNGLAINPYREDVALAGAAVTGLGCRPTRRWVFEELQRHFEHVYVPLTQPNHAEFPIDWSADAAAVHPCAARSVFIASRRAKSNPLLVGEIPMRQRRC